MSIEMQPGDGSKAPSIEAVQRDVGFANEFRLEVIKTMLAIGTALLAFTMAFRPTLNPVEYEWAMVIGWAGLAASLLGGIVTMYCWELFYISYRDYDWKMQPKDGPKYRKKVNRYRKVAFGVQCVGFLLGVGGVAMFAAVNVANVQEGAKSGQATEAKNDS